MLMAVNEPYALMVQPDDILISPREVDEHFGTMVCFHPRYALGDHHNYMDKDDFLREMYLDTVGHDEAGMKRYERMVNIVSSRFRHGPKTEERAIDEAMQKVISEKYLMLPLYLYDHSGLAMSTESFSGRAPHAEWDSGQVGWIYVSKEDALKDVLVVGEDFPWGGVTAEVVSRIVAEGFHLLDAPPQRLNARDTPIPQHPNLWKAHRPTLESIAASIRHLLSI